MRSKYSDVVVETPSSALSEILVRCAHLRVEFHDFFRHYNGRALACSSVVDRERERERERENSRALPEDFLMSRDPVESPMIDCAGLAWRERDAYRSNLKFECNYERGF